jgi:hypothetical protein
VELEGGQGERCERDVQDAGLPAKMAWRGVALKTAWDGRVRRSPERHARIALSAAHHLTSHHSDVRKRCEGCGFLSASHHLTPHRRVEELELRCGRLTEVNKQLELRRHLDCEGWTADVSALRRTLTAVDRKLHEMRLVERCDRGEERGWRGAVQALPRAAPVRAWLVWERGFRDAAARCRSTEPRKGVNERRARACVR